MRWIKEFFNPKLKCERAGHDIKEVSVKIRKIPEEIWSRAVVVDCKAKQSYCKRCRAELSEPYDIEQIKYFTSCSMPGDMWDTMQEKGYVEL